MFGRRTSEREIARRHGIDPEDAAAVDAFFRARTNDEREALIREYHASVVPRPGFSVTPPAAALPGFDPSESPLSPGGRRAAPAPAPADASFFGLVEQGARRDARRVTYRVRREGWVARREAARTRFRSLGGSAPSSTPRLLSGLDRRGVLAESKSQAVRPRFNLRRA